MPKASPIQACFNAGEISPRLESRVQFDARQHGVKTMENFVSVVQGAAVSRPGTEFLDIGLAATTSQTVLIPFVFNVDDAYVLEFSPGTFRLWKDGAVVQAATGGDYERENPYGNVTFYDANGNCKLQWAQAANVMYFAHPEFPPVALRRLSSYFGLSGKYVLDAATAEDHVWTFMVGGSGTGAQDFTNFTAEDYGRVHQNGPYLDPVIDYITLTPSGTTGSITLTSNAKSYFQTGWIGRQIRLLDPVSGEWTWGYVTANGTGPNYFECTFTIVGPDLTGTADITTLAPGAWHAATIYESVASYPRAVVFYQDRIWYGGAAAVPPRVDASQVDDFTDFTISDPDETTADSYAIAVLLLANQANVVEWLFDDERGLVVGTSGGVWLLSSNDTSSGITPSTVQAKRVTADACAPVKPVRVGKQIMFVQRGGQKLRALGYNLDDDSLRADDVTKLAEHITAPGITALALQAEPYNILWVRRRGGALLGYTSSTADQVAGWHRHLIGIHPGTSTPKSVKSLAVIPGASYDELYLYTGGYSSDEWVLRLADYFRDDTDLEDAFCVDAGVTHDGAAITSLTGLDHLEGVAVTILADGAVQGPETVDGGAVPISPAASVVHAGLAYVPTIVTLRIEAGAADGTAQGKLKHITRVIFRFLKTLGAWVGWDEDHMEEIPFVTTGDDMDEVPDLYDGDKTVEWDAGFEPDGYIRVEQRDPRPMTLLAVMPRVTTEDG